jgi:hypothetical protein
MGGGTSEKQKHAHAVEVLLLVLPADLSIPISCNPVSW